jgi:HSP20 family molecular chaperone IbpA
MKNHSIQIRPQHPLVKVNKKPDIVIKIDQTPPEEEPPRRILSPKVDIRERPDDMILLINLPGVDSADIQLHLKGPELSLTAPANIHCPFDHHPERIEASSCLYERTFRVSDKFDTSKIEAHLNSGVLRVRLLKTPATRPRKIKVRPG